MPPLLNTADRIYLGEQEADAVYAGATKVWPSWTPASIAGLAIWYDASQETSIGSAWTDRSGTGHHGTIVGSPAPVVLPGILNGLPVVQFTKDQGRVRVTGSGVDKDYTLVYLARNWHTSGWSAGQRIVNSNYPPSNVLFGWWYGNEDAAYATPAFLEPDPKQPWSTTNGPIWKLYSADCQTSPLRPRFFRNGIKIAEAVDDRHDGWMGYFNISGYDATGTQELTDCQVAEVVLYNRKLPDNERQMVEGYMRDKWGLT